MIVQAVVVPSSLHPLSIEGTLIFYKESVETKAKEMKSTLHAPYEHQCIILASPTKAANAEDGFKQHLQQFPSHVAVEMELHCVSIGVS